MGLLVMLGQRPSVIKGNIAKQAGPVKEYLGDLIGGWRFLRKRAPNASPTIQRYPNATDGYHLNW